MNSYLPILSMILVNSSEAGVHLLINDEESIIMHSWYRSFQGDIEQISMEKYKDNGIDKSVRITELSIRV
ncbi:hypothetical protein C1645_822199 [Glomus cerebriforme]|uniref:Uncharacterized protein n=1 Tax=Glomus cerebriforme TaxID=658196 RepID=A0A397SZ40_9GLOM|nr:hypothetical protein C1645_822199 [Glomus cerebriforme]